MEHTIKIFIYIHAFFGGIALLAGMASIVFLKGSKNHKKAGKVFSYGMVISSLISLPICWLPNHKNIFLFLIGFFTIYLVISGNRVLLFKNKKEADWIDKTTSGILLVSSLLMLFFGIVFSLKSQSVGKLFLFFGLIAFVMALRDFIFYKNIDKKRVILFHIGKMSGAYIAAVTAFLVAGIKFQGLIYWIAPTIIGTIFIVYWIRKMKRVSTR